MSSSARASGWSANFRQFFLEQLEQVRVAYPEAKADADHRGLMLWPSPPPVPERVRAVHPPARDHV